MTESVAVATVLPMSALLIGAMLGLFSSLLLENRRQANGVAAKIIETYLEIRRELCDQLSDLAALRTETVPSGEELLAKRDAVANLIYRYYDFMPKRVIQEMTCLYACLGDRENRIFVVRDNELRLANEREVMSMIADISLLENSKFYALVPLRSDDRATRRAASIRSQARRVLTVLNQDLTIRALLSWSRSLRK